MQQQCYKGISSQLTNSISVEQNHLLFLTNEHLNDKSDCKRTDSLLLLLLSRFSRVRLFSTPWTAAYQAPLPMGFSRPEYWSGLPLPSLTDSLLLLLLSRFSRVRLCATPQTAAHQAALSLGFSRQEYWSGLPFPSPIHEREK